MYFHACMKVHDPFYTGAGIVLFFKLWNKLHKMEKKYCFSEDNMAV